MNTEALRPLSTTVMPSGTMFERVLLRLCQLGCAWFALSAITLPFVDWFWLGEMAPLALLQLPKSFLKSLVQAGLLSLMHQWGLSCGSASPDFIATHGWALLSAVVIPPMLLITCLSFWRWPQRRYWLMALVACAACDAVVTLWFDSMSHLKLYNAVYF